MNLFKYTHRKDFGDQYSFQFLMFKFKDYKWSVLQFSVSWDEYSSSPYAQITAGSNGLFGALLWVYKLGIDIDIFSRTWNFDYIYHKQEEYEMPN